MKKLIVMLLVLTGLLVGMLSVSILTGWRKPDAGFFIDSAIWMSLLLFGFGWGWFHAHRPASSVMGALLASTVALLGVAGAWALWYLGWWTGTVAAPSMVGAVFIVVAALIWDPVLAERRERRKNQPPARAFGVIQPASTDGPQ